MLRYFFILILISFGIRAQNNIYELGGSVSASIMDSDYGYIPGLGFKIDHRINFAKSNFVIKNSLGISSYSQRDIGGTLKKGKSTLYMLDAMLEYNLFSLDKIHVYTQSKQWTPYIGGGVNLIYVNTDSFKGNDGSNGNYITLKGSLGIKYRLNKKITFTTEGFLEWDFCDALDGYENSPEIWYQFDHTANFSIGLIYRLNTNLHSKR
jgi:hypothetical protein